MNKQKQVHKTREELIADLKNNKDFQVKMKFTKEVFYPALSNATTSIEDALQNLSIINSFIMEKFLGFMKEKKMSDINIIDSLSKDDAHYYEMKTMLELFNDYSIFEAKELLEGMRAEIQLFLSEENKSRTLHDLKVKWLGDL